MSTREQGERGSRIHAGTDGLLASPVRSVFCEMDQWISRMHEGLARKSRLRRFLSNFANDEALHYLVAKRALLCVGLDVLPSRSTSPYGMAYPRRRRTPARPALRRGVHPREHRGWSRSIDGPKHLGGAVPRAGELPLHRAAPARGRGPMESSFSRQSPAPSRGLRCTTILRQERGGSRTVSAHVGVRTLPVIRCASVRPECSRSCGKPGHVLSNAQGNRMTPRQRPSRAGVFAVSSVGTAIWLSIHVAAAVLASVMAPVFL